MLCWLDGWVRLGLYIFKFKYRREEYATLYHYSLSLIHYGGDEDTIGGGRPVSVNCES